MYGSSSLPGLFDDYWEQKQNWNILVMCGGISLMDIAIMAQKHSSFTYLMTLVSEVKPYLSSAEKDVSRDTEHFYI